MPEIKNTFVKSKMNKDLDSRLIPNGEYRDGLNISVSTSEGADVGALENIRGNFELSNFGLTDFNLEVIGSFVDTASNRIYFFITNFVDGSASQLDNRPASTATATTSDNVVFEREGAKNCIAYCQIPYLEDSELSSINITSEILVEGAFLNFSKTHPIIGVNLVEDLLFFTDNRNQPRKINVETAISNPLTYYKSEDDISVAKFAPYKPISFLDHDGNSTLKNEVDEWLPAFFISPGQNYAGNANNPVVPNLLLFNAGDFGPAGSSDNYASPAQHIGGLNPANPGEKWNSNSASFFDVRVYRLNDENKNYAYVKEIETGATSGGNLEDNITLQDINGNVINDIEEELGWDSGTFAFQIKNPHYKPTFSGDKEFLKDKFVKFSYRLKYDDNEYSILAPFSQHAFVPKQYGYFIGADDTKTAESSIVDFMENQISTAGLCIDLPYSLSDIGVESGKKLKAKEIQLIYKASDELSLKVIADLKINDIKAMVSGISVLDGSTGYQSGGNDVPTTTVTGNGSGLTLNFIIDTNDPSGEVINATVVDPGSNYSIGDIIQIDAPAFVGGVSGEDSEEEEGDGSGEGTGATFVISEYSSRFCYNYESQKPIKVLDEKEISRVNDIVPIRALSQEVVGNRVVYGNFLQNKETPSSLNYKIIQTTKGADTKKEYLNHTLKQGITYQVGIVLQDRYGRASNVITNDSGSDLVNSTFYSEYTNGGVNPLNWPGDSLQAQFLEKISENKTDRYNGIYDEETNPLGWYTYKVVIKQQEQDYYNIYVPGCLSGNVNFTKLNEPLSYTDAAAVSHIALFNDNINKLPRDLKEVGPSDTIYGSSVVLYNRVKNSFNGITGNNNPDANVPDVNDQNLETPKIEVTTIKPFRDFGDWATKKNVNIRYIEAVYDPNADGGTGSLVGPYYAGGDKYIYPGAEGNVDPLFLKNNKNPLIATLSVTDSSRLGYSSSDQKDEFEFAKKLMVFETKPVKSALDIYYETSSTGLIKDFNEAVDYPVGNNGQPVGLTDFQPTWQENVNPTDVSNIFQTVDSNGDPLVGGINGGNPSVQINQVFQFVNGQYVVAQSPFNLQTVNPPSANISATYKLRTNDAVVYNNGSFNSGKYRVEFKLTVDNGQDVIVTEDVPLTNVVPKTEFVQTPAGATGFFPEIDTRRYLLRSYTDSEIDNIFGSAAGRYWNDDGLPAPVVQSGADAGKPINNETVVNWRVVHRSQMLEFNRSWSSNKTYDAAILCPSHSTNGAATLPATPNNTNRNGNAPPQSGPVLTPPPEGRLSGLVYQIHQVRRYMIQYFNNTGEWYTLPTALNHFVDKTNDFEIENSLLGPVNGFDNGYGTVFFRPGGTFQNSDFHSGSGWGSGQTPAHAYVIRLKTIDTGNGDPGKESSIANFIFIVTKETFSVPRYDHFS